MSSMNSRFKGLGFGSKRKSSANVPTIAQNPTTSTPQLAGRPTPSTASSSTTSLPMNHPGPGGRPPSYTNNYSPAPASVGRTQSPMAGTPRTPPSQVMGGPPPINTAASGYPPGHPAGGMGAPPPAGGPPQYGPPQYGAPVPPGGGSVAAAQYANRNNAVEVEGAGRSKAQLIVGIDFVSHLFSIREIVANSYRELLSPVSLSPSQPILKQRKISSQNGQAQDHIRNKRCGRQQLYAISY
jgi:hypothetical protein